MPPKAKKAAPKRGKVAPKTVEGIHPLPPSLPAVVPHLSGNLSDIPLEIFTAVLTELNPASFYALLGTCKALPIIVQQNATSLFCRLYHAHIARQRQNGGNHFRFSPARRAPVKNEVAQVFPPTSPLPLNAVYDWEVQYKCSVKTLPLSNGERPCTICGRIVDHMRSISQFKFHACLACFAKSIVNKSAINVYHLTANDLGGILPTQLMAEGLTGGKLADFYFSVQLHELARQKHGDSFEPIPVLRIQEEERVLRADQVGVATLLHAGISPRCRIVSPDTELWVGHFSTELDHYIDKKTFKKSKFPIKPHPLGHLTYAELKKRPLDEILDDFIDLVTHNNEFPLRSDGNPFFLPAETEEDLPTMPTEEMIAAYQKIRELAELHGYFESKIGARYKPIMGVAGSPLEFIRAAQSYVLERSDENWERIHDEILDIFLVKQHRLKKAPRGPITPYDDISELSDTIDPNMAYADARLARLKIIKQISTILGQEIKHAELKDAIDNPFDIYDADESCFFEGFRKFSSVDKFPLWFGPFLLEGVVTGFRTEFAQVISQNRKKQWNKVTLDHSPSNDSLFMEFMFSRAMATFSPAYVARVQFDLERGKLSDQCVNEETYEAIYAEVTNVTKAMADGFISASAFTATLHALGRCTYDGIFGEGGSEGCFDGCWIKTQQHIDYAGYPDFDDDYDY